MALPVRITCGEFSGFKLGLVYGPCKYDTGVIVQLTAPRHEGVADFVCIQTERGDTIVPIEK